MLQCKNQGKITAGGTMSLDKAIQHGDEHRKEYKGSKAIDPSCRNHGSCEWCKGNRLIRSRRETSKLDSKEEEYLNSDE